ncbi:hypothetical protein NUSPORA_00566 [Nucleospora cyclopteri]
MNQLKLLKIKSFLQNNGFNYFLLNKLAHKYKKYPDVLEIIAESMFNNEFYDDSSILYFYLYCKSKNNKYLKLSIVGAQIALDFPLKPLKIRDDQNLITNKQQGASQIALDFPLKPLKIRDDQNLITNKQQGASQIALDFPLKPLKIRDDQNLITNKQQGASQLILDLFLKNPNFDLFNSSITVKIAINNYFNNATIKQLLKKYKYFYGIQSAFDLLNYMEKKQAIEKLNVLSQKCSFFNYIKIDSIKEINRSIKKILFKIINMGINKEKYNDLYKTVIYK